MAWKRQLTAGLGLLLAAGATLAGGGEENRGLSPIIMTTTQSTAQRYDRVIGVCHLSENPFVPKSAVNVLSPSMEVTAYYRKQEHLTIGNQPSVSVLQMPVHGSLVDEGGGYYAYYPEKGYLGNDRATLLVEVGGKRVKMEYFFRVMKSIPQQYDEVMPTPYEESNCPKKTAVWKISSATDAYGNNFIAAADYQLLIRVNKSK